MLLKISSLYITYILKHHPQWSTNKYNYCVNFFFETAFHYISLGSLEVGP